MLWDELLSFAALAGITGIEDGGLRFIVFSLRHKLRIFTKVRLFGMPGFVKKLKFIIPFAAGPIYPPPRSIADSPAGSIFVIHCCSSAYLRSGISCRDWDCRQRHCTDRSSASLRMAPSGG